MIGVPAISPLVVAPKDFILDQTYNGFTVKFNGGGMGFTVGAGLGSSTSGSHAVIANVGGFSEQHIQAVLRYVSPTVAGGENIAVMARYQCLDGSAQGYYEIRQYQGAAYIIRRLNGAYTTLASQAFAVQQNTDLELDIYCEGTNIEATFTSAGPGTITLNASDASFSKGGAGFIAFGSTIFCREFNMEQIR